MTRDANRAKSYFDKLAPEYDRAFRWQGRGALNALVNRSFRSTTFERRMRMLESLFGELGLEGRQVLDLGCGSGQVTELVASLGARVHAVDISPRMLEIARQSIERAGLIDRVTFEQGDVTSLPLPGQDVVMLIGVVEYHRDVASLIARAAKVARGTLVVAHTNRVAYRMLLRRVLFWLDGSNLYFHPMEDVIGAAESAGLRLARRLPEHAFTLLVFERSGPRSDP